LLETFSRASRLQVSDEADHRAEQCILDMLIALTRATPEQPRVIQLPVTG